jgi:hypothetical protein
MGRRTTIAEVDREPRRRATTPPPGGGPDARARGADWPRGARSAGTFSGCPRLRPLLISLADRKLPQPRPRLQKPVPGRRLLAGCVVTEISTQAQASPSVRVPALTVTTFWMDGAAVPWRHTRSCLGQLSHPSLLILGPWVRVPPGSPIVSMGYLIDLRIPGDATLIADPRRTLGVRERPSTTTTRDRNWRNRGHTTDPASPEIFGAGTR